MAILAAAWALAIALGLGGVWGSVCRCGCVSECVCYYAYVCVCAFCLYLISCLWKYSMKRFTTKKTAKAKPPCPNYTAQGRGKKIRFLRQRAGTVRPTLAGHQRYGFKSQPEQVCLRHPHAFVFSLEIFFHFGKIWPDWGQMEFSKMAFHALLGIITAFCSLSLCLGHNLGWTWLIMWGDCYRLWVPPTSPSPPTGTAGSRVSQSSPNHFYRRRIVFSPRGRRFS